MAQSIRFVALCLLLGAAGACTLARPLAHHATSYNVAVEETQNRMLLLNVVRASQNKPMYFTDVGSITADLSYTVDSGSLSLTDFMSTVTKSSVVTGQTDSTTSSRDLTNSDTELLKLPSVSYSNKPTLTVSVLDDQEFMQGTLAPISAEVMQYYFDQGWNSRLILYLMVERIEFDVGSQLDTEVECENEIEPKGSRRVIRNDPDNTDHAACFEAYLSAFLANDCRLRTARSETDLVSLTEEPSLGELIKAETSGFGIRVAAASSGRPPVTVFKKGFHLRLECGTQLPVYGAINPRDYAASSGYNFSIFLRSPQGVLFYLGELLSLWQRGLDGDPETELHQIPLIRPDGANENGFPCPDPSEGETCLPLFLAREGTDCGGASVAVSYGEKIYMIPAPPERAPCELTWGVCHPGRSMQALTLASQLLTLQKKGERFPGTSLVRVVGN